MLALPLLTGRPRRPFARAAYIGYNEARMCVSLEAPGRVTRMRCFGPPPRRTFVSRMRPCRVVGQRGRAEFLVPGQRGVGHTLPNRRERRGPQLQGAIV